jgi:hypothetical protein
MTSILSFTPHLALLLALVSRGNVRQVKVPMFEAQKLSRGIVHNVNICDRAGSLKLRPVPSTKRNKDNKTFNYTSTPPGANILLGAVVPRVFVVLNLLFLSNL